MSNQITTVRLPIETEKKLLALSKHKGKTKSDIIKDSLDMYYERVENELDSYTLGLAYFGKHSLGDANLSTTYKDRIKENISAKQNYY